MDESLRLPPNLAAILEDLPLGELAFVPVPVKPRRDGWTPSGSSPSFFGSHWSAESRLRQRPSG